MPYYTVYPQPDHLNNAILYSIEPQPNHLNNVILQPPI